MPYLKLKLIENPTEITQNVLLKTKSIYKKVICFFAINKAQKFQKKTRLFYRSLSFKFPTSQPERSGVTVTADHIQ